MTKINQLLKNLGPGLLYAGAAIGVSHLVGSTKAGAKYSFLLLLCIPLIHIIKYPFYKFGPQYTAITGKNILHGYRALGKWALATYIGMTLLVMCLIQAAVTIVTSSIAVKFFKINIPEAYMPHIPAIFCLIMAAAILYLGKYSLLDKVMKFVILTLTATTLFALSMCLIKAPTGFYPEAISPNFDLTSYSDALFLAAFLGWMPAPMDITVWHSVWSEEANRDSGERASVKKAMFDFKVGYIGTAILAMCFLSLGALVMYGSGETPAKSGVAFAGQLIQLYTHALGDWSYPLIGIAALATMVSTTLTCLDAYPRTLDESILIWKDEHEGSDRKADSKKIYRGFLMLAVAGTIIIFLFFLKSMSQIVTLATVVAFVSAPILALINHLVMNGKTIPKEERPSKLIKTWSQLGILCLTIFSIWYVWIAFIRDQGLPQTGDKEPPAPQKTEQTQLTPDAPK